jgi:hypothetical protein
LSQKIFFFAFPGGLNGFLFSKIDSGGEEKVMEDESIAEFFTPQRLRKKRKEDKEKILYDRFQRIVDGKDRCSTLVSERIVVTETSRETPNIETLRDAVNCGARNIEKIIECAIALQRIDLLRLSEELSEKHNTIFNPQMILRKALTLHWQEGVEATIIWGACPNIGLEEATVVRNWEGVAMAVKGGAKNLVDTIEKLRPEDKFIGLKNAKRIADDYCPELSKKFTRRMLIEAASSGQIEWCQEAIDEGANNFHEGLEKAGGNIEVLEFIQEQIKKKWEKGKKKEFKVSFPGDLEDPCI